MTVIAFDGKSISADKMAVESGLIRKCTKIFLIRHFTYGKCIVAISGDLAGGHQLIKWFNAGEEAKDWPENQKTDNWSRLIILSKDGLFLYEQLCQKIFIEDQVFACGSGRDFAMGAMLQGASAMSAVAIASRLCDSCGEGIDTFSLKDLE